MNTKRALIAGSFALALFSPASSVLRAEPAADDGLAKKIFETMSKVYGVNPAFRPVHAKGIVCHGTFEPSKAAAGLSKAAHFQAAVPITVRYSDGSSDPMIPDNAGNAGPRGMAIRFEIPGGDEVDIVAMSHNGFVVSNGQEFLELQQAVVATDPSKPHPWPVEAFLGAHPLALRFVTENTVIPESFATEGFFSNDAFIFVNKDGVRQAGRYKIVPAAGKHDLSAADAKAKSPNFLITDLKDRLAKAPLKYDLVVQLPGESDRTIDPSLVWPDDRKTITVGQITVASVDPKSDEAQNALAYDPTNLTDGIELSDDTLPTLRSQVYALSVEARHVHQK